MGLITFSRDWEERRRRLFQRSLVLIFPSWTAGLAIGLVTKHRPLTYASALGSSCVFGGFVCNLGATVVKAVRGGQTYSAVDTAAAAGVVSTAGVVLFHHIRSRPTQQMLARIPRIGFPVALGAGLAHLWTDFALDRAEHRYVKTMIQDKKDLKYVAPYLRYRYMRYQREGVPEYFCCPTLRDAKFTLLSYIGKIPGVVINPDELQYSYRLVDRPDPVPEPTTQPPYSFWLFEPTPKQTNEEDEAEDDEEDE